MSNSQPITEVAWTRAEHEGTPRFKVDGDLVYVYIDNSSRRYTRGGARALAHGILTALDGARWAMTSTSEPEDAAQVEELAAEIELAWGTQSGIALPWFNTIARKLIESGWRKNSATAVTA